MSLLMELNFLFDSRFYKDVSPLGFWEQSNTRSCWRILNREIREIRQKGGRLHFCSLQTDGFVAKFIIDPDAKGITGQVALAVWVTHEGQPGPVQATGGWLAKSQQKE
jgi:hypothetical protein